MRAIVENAEGKFEEVINMLKEAFNLFDILGQENKA